MAPEAATPLIVTDPSTGRELASIDVTTEMELREKFELAREAQQQWAETPLEARKSTLERFMAFLAADAVKADLASTMAQETGKPVTQGLGETDACGYRCQWFLDNAHKFTAAFLPEPEQYPTDSVEIQPIGVCAFLSAWNFPTLMTVDYLMPALLCGNAVIIKPSEYASMTACKIKTLLDEAGVPRYLVQLAIGGPKVGQCLLSLPLASVVFIGSTAVGEQVRHSGTTPRRIVLELGGNDPFYVHSDVKVSSVATALAEGKHDMMGENCDACERIYVHEDVWDHFVKSFVETVEAFQIGDPQDEATYIGPLFCEALLAPAIRALMFLMRHIRITTMDHESLSIDHY